ncbi:unnamed protein product, partial [Symbiodinium microadriaticum]
MIREPQTQNPEPQANNRKPKPASPNSKHKPKTPSPSSPSEVCLAAIAFGQDYVNDTANSSDGNTSAEVLSTATATTTVSTLSSTTTFTVSRTTSTQSSTSATSTTETFTTATSTSQTTTTTESNTTTSSTTTTTYTNTTQTITSSTATTLTTSLTSTTTSFTSTNTTTTTSTTTTRVYFLSVDLAQLTATHLTLSFNYPARWVQETNVTWGCHALFDTVTAGKLGLSPGCSMSEDLVRLQVVLGERSYLHVGDLVTLLFGVFVPASG